MKKLLLLLLIGACSDTTLKIPDPVSCVIEDGEYISAAIEKDRIVFKDCAIEIKRFNCTMLGKFPRTVPYPDVYRLNVNSVKGECLMHDDHCYIDIRSPKAFKLDCEGMDMIDLFQSIELYE